MSFGLICFNIVLFNFFVCLSIRFFRSIKVKYLLFKILMSFYLTRDLNPYGKVKAHEFLSAFSHSFSKRVIECVVFGNDSCKSFDKVIPDLLWVDFILPQGFRKFCLNSIHQTSISRPMNLCDLASCIVFVLS